MFNHSVDHNKPVRTPLLALYHQVLQHTGTADVLQLRVGAELGRALLLSAAQRRLTFCGVEGGSVPAGHGVVGTS